MNSKYAPWLLFLSPLAYLLSAILIAALLAYPLYLVIDLKIAFPRLVNRLGLGFLIIGIFPARKKFGLSAGEMGFPGNWSSLMLQVSKGFLLGAVILGIVVITLIALDVRSVMQNQIDGTARLVRHLAGALGTGMIVAVLEESLFRGLLFGALLKYGNTRSALLITAFFYAGLHFIGGRGEVPAEELRWTSGLELVPAALVQIFNLANLDSFLALFVVSLFLCAVLIETPGGIGYCIGLHAAWVFIIKLTKRYTGAVPDSPWSFLIGSYDGVIGCLVLVWLLLITLVYGHRIRKKHRTTITLTNQ
ncbi:MAG: CPBP family intramembrane glutamic endopeptidase [Methylococcales bacterium]